MMSGQCGCGRRDPVEDRPGTGKSTVYMVRFERGAFRPRRATETQDPAASGLHSTRNARRGHQLDSAGGRSSRRIVGRFPVVRGAAGLSGPSPHTQDYPQVPGTIIHGEPGGVVTQWTNGDM